MTCEKGIATIVVVTVTDGQKILQGAILSILSYQTAFGRKMKCRELAVDQNQNQKSSFTYWEP